MKVDSRELAWAAGLFEGEGCIGLYTPQRADGRTNGRPQIRLFLSMADRDSVDRFQRAIGGLGNRTEYRNPHKPHWKPQSRWNTYKFEHCQAILAMLWYGFGERRQAKCIEVLEACARARS
jgi:hypothetical protein